MIDTIAAQELGCIRYAGTDPAVKRRLVEVGEPDALDGP